MSDTPTLKIRFMALNYAPERSGIAPYTAAVAVALAERDHDVEVLTSRPHYPEWQVAKGFEDSSRSVHDRVTVRRFRHYIPSKPRWYKRAVFEVSFGARLLFARWGQPDVVICVSPALISTAMVATRVRLSRHRPALGVIVQDLYSRGVQESGGKGGRLARLATRLESRTLNQCDSVVVIHERFKKQLVENLGVEESRVSVIRNWNHVTPTFDCDVPAVRDALGWGDETVVLHAGAMGVKQDLRNVVEAARYADSVDARVRFVLLGDGSQREALTRAAQGVRSLEFRDSLDNATFGRALIAADVLLVNEGPGLRDMAVPSKLTSYFRAGRPIIAVTDESSTTAYELAAARSGVRVEPGRPQELVDAVLGLINDPVAAEAMSLRGQEYCRSVLSADTALRKYDDWVARLHEQRVEADATGRLSRRRPSSEPRDDTG